jgi:hypothetical protein
MKLSDEQIQRLNNAGFKWCLEAKKKFEKERVHAVRGGRMKIMKQIRSTRTEESFGDGRSKLFPKIQL